MSLKGLRGADSTAPTVLKHRQLRTLDMPTARCHVVDSYHLSPLDDAVAMGV